MQKITFIVITILVVCKLSAQQDGYQTHFQFNEISFNPSYAGKVDGKICFSSLFHQQYLGFKSDAIFDDGNKAVITPYDIAPQTQYFTISTRLFNQFGIAFQFMKDEIGPQEIKLPKLNLSYYFNGSVSHFAIGLYAGEMQKSLDGNKLVPLSMLQFPNLPDPNVPDTKVTGNKFDVGLGIHYINQTWNNLNIGFSATHLLRSDFTFINRNQNTIPFSTLETHYCLNASMDFPVSANIILQPNLLFKYGGKFQTDANILAIYNRAFYGGFSFREEDNINLMLGYLWDEFKIGYAFDFIVNGLKPGTKTTHELFIQYCYTIKIPRGYLINPRHLKDFKY